jgi:hypothetical protein
MHALGITKETPCNSKAYFVNPLAPKTTLVDTQCVAEKTRHHQKLLAKNFAK